MSKSVQHRYVMLLTWAVMALVLNPVWHAMGHSLSDHHSTVLDNEFEVHWEEEELCLYCDAISHHADVPQFEASIGQFAQIGDIEPQSLVYADQRRLVYSRLRAPPVLS